MVHDLFHINCLTLSQSVLIEASRPISVDEMKKISFIKNLQLDQRTPTRVPRYAGFRETRVAF